MGESFVVENKQTYSQLNFRGLRKNMVAPAQNA